MKIRVVKISVCGIKNISEPLVIDFSSKIAKDVLKKVANVKGIFGINGTGKTAFITAIDIYKNICISKNYLIQKNTVRNLDKMINFSTKKLDIEVTYSILDMKKNWIIKHFISIAKNGDEYELLQEKVSRLKSRSLNDQFEDVIDIAKGKTNYNIEINEISEDLNRNRSFICLYGLYLSKKENFYTIDFIDDTFDFIFVFIGAINIRTVFLDADSHKDYLANMDKKILDLISEYSKNKISKNNETLSDVIKTTEGIDDLVYTDFLPGSERVEKKELGKYQSHIIKLTKFIRIFKPSLVEIKLDKKVYGDYYIVRKQFVYSESPEPIDFEFESAGIKNLVYLFSSLLYCANGGITFIDEIDTNINSVYLNKLIEFFIKYGKGQLCFTSHNMDTIDLLKNTCKGISFFGMDGSIDNWTQIGNKSPKNSFISGKIENNPMNIEAIDFLSVLNEEEN